MKNAIREVRSAGGVVINAEGKILFCHPTGSRWNNWRMPKGRIDDGENMEKTAIREVLEETGLYCKIIRKLEQEAEYRSRDELGTILKQVVLFLMEPIEETQKPDNEMDAFRWVPFDKIDEYVADTERPLIMEAIEVYKSLPPKERKKSNSKRAAPKKS